MYVFNMDKFQQDLQNTKFKVKGEVISRMKLMENLRSPGERLELVGFITDYESEIWRLTEQGLNPTATQQLQILGDFPFLNCAFLM